MSSGKKKVKISLSDESMDEIVIFALKEGLDVLKSFKGTFLNPLDQIDHEKDLRAIKRVLKYYGGM